MWDYDCCYLEHCVYSNPAIITCNINPFPAIYQPSLIVVATVGCMYLRMLEAIAYVKCAVSSVSQDIDFSSTSSSAPPLSSSSLPQAASHVSTTSVHSGLGILANLNVRPPLQAVAPPIVQTNLLDLLDNSIPPSEPSSLPTGESASTGNIPPAVATPPTSRNDPMSDFAMLGPITSSSSSLTTPTMALSLLDSSVNSIQVPSEYVQYPIAPDCENKVCGAVDVAR